MNNIQFWLDKEEAIINLLVDTIRKKEIVEMDRHTIGWYGGQLDLIRKIIKYEL